MKPSEEGYGEDWTILWRHIFIEVAVIDTVLEHTAKKIICVVYELKWSFEGISLWHPA